MGMYIMAVVDIVVVEPDVMRVGLSAILKGELFAILDMVFKLAIVHDEPGRFVGYPLLMFLVG